MGSLSYHSLVWRKGDSNCCPSGGAVDIKFRLDRGRIIVTRKHFDPSTGPVD
jgi:hypothetical protein